MVSKSDQAAFRRFNTVALARIAEGVFQIPEEPPFWLLPFLDQGKESNDQIIFDDPLSFIANFLIDGEDRWQLESVGGISSGVYSVQTNDSPELFYECRADFVRGEAVLLIELLGEGSPGAIHDAVRAARSQRLAGESGLGQTHLKQSFETNTYLSGMPSYEAFISEDGQIISESCNAAFRQVFASVLVGSPRILPCLESLNEFESVLAKVKSALNRGQVENWSVQMANEQERSIQLDVFPLENMTARLVVRDVSDRSCADRWLAGAADRSTVTGLLNGRSFNSRIDNAIKFFDELKSEPDKGALGVLYFNVDGFNSINETYGRQAGDALLVAIAERAVSNIGPICTLFHFEADEFVVAVESLESGDSIDVFANSLRETLNEPYMLRFLTHDVSVCLGVAVYEQDAATADSLMVFAKNNTN